MLIITVFVLIAAHALLAAHPGRTPNKRTPENFVLVQRTSEIRKLSPKQLFNCQEIAKNYRYTGLKLRYTYYKFRNQLRHSLRFDQLRNFAEKCEVPYRYFPVKTPKLALSRVVERA